MSTELRNDAVGDESGVPGLAIRPYAGVVDHDHIVRLQNAEWQADGVSYRISRPEIDAWARHPSDQFDPARDLRFAELDGVPVAVTWTDWVDAADGVREYRSRGFVEPAARRRGIGRAVLADNMRRLRGLAGMHDTPRSKVLGLPTAEHNVGAAMLARSRGYEPERWFFGMERPIGADLPPIGPLPDGLDIRPVDRADGWALWEADHDAFRDHWGGFDASEASYRRWTESPEFDPTMFVVAFDGDEIAGAVLNVIYREENELLGLRRGWLDSVFTRRAWRRRGLARGLIVRSLHLLRERGMDRAALGVDANNPSGALGLYESTGFAVTERSTAWRRPMEKEEDR
jgi:GNAT superfamily N-acetyltransferase